MQEDRLRVSELSGDQGFALLGENVGVNRDYSESIALEFLWCEDLISEGSQSRSRLGV
jgi:hypothetical protein